MLLCYTGGIASAPPPHARFESGHGAWPSVRVETASYPHGRTRCFSPRHSAHSPFCFPARAPTAPPPQPTRPFHSSCSRVPPLPAQCKPVAHPGQLIDGRIVPHGAPSPHSLTHARSCSRLLCQIKDKGVRLSVRSSGLARALGLNFGFEIANQKTGDIHNGTWHESSPLCPQPHASGAVPVGFSLYLNVSRKSVETTLKLMLTIVDRSSCLVAPF